MIFLGGRPARRSSVMGWPVAVVATWGATAAGARVVAVNTLSPSRVPVGSGTTGELLFVALAVVIAFPALRRLGQRQRRPLMVITSTVALIAAFIGMTQILEWLLGPS